MAFRTDIISERGVVYPNQYCRVDAVRATKTSMEVDLGVYLDTPSEGDVPHRLDTFRGSFDLFSPLNAWQQAYGVVKEYFPSTVDC